jgi:hypothetical protein
LSSDNLSYFIIFHTLIYRPIASRIKAFIVILGVVTRVFDNVVVVAFQIIFYAEIHVNDFFYFLKIIFDISTLKLSKKYKQHSILTKKII